MGKKPLLVTRYSLLGTDEGGERRKNVTRYWLLGNRSALRALRSARPVEYLLFIPQGKLEAKTPQKNVTRYTLLVTW